MRIPHNENKSFTGWNLITISYTPILSLLFYFVKKKKKKSRSKQAGPLSTTLVYHQLKSYNSQMLNTVLTDTSGTAFLLLESFQCYASPISRRDARACCLAFLITRAQFFSCNCSTWPQKLATVEVTMHSFPLLLSSLALASWGSSGEVTQLTPEKVALIPVAVTVPLESAAEVTVGQITLTGPVLSDMPVSRSLSGAWFPNLRQFLIPPPASQYPATGFFNLQSQFLLLATWNPLWSKC